MAKGGLRGALEGANVRWGRQNRAFAPCHGTPGWLLGALARRRGTVGWLRGFVRRFRGAAQRGVGA